MGDNGYPLDLWSPVRHVATAMDRAAPAFLSIDELAVDYRHAIPADLMRIKQQEGCVTDEDAIKWLVGRAVEEITYQGKTDKSRVQVVANGHGYRLADGMTFEDLLYQGRKLHRAFDAHVQLRDPFNPMSGRWSANVRRNTGKEPEEAKRLRESMREFGWLEWLPAIKDERGVVLVGHRRLAIAEELGIDPVWWHEHGRPHITLGDGDEADAKRFRLAVASNLGAKPFTPEERADLAEYLYGERDWTMTRIAQALDVSTATVQRDLSHREKGPARPGRPRKKVTEELIADMQPYIEAGQPVPSRALAEKYDVSAGTVWGAQQQARGRQEGKQAGTATPASELSPAEVPPHACTCPNCGDVHEATEATG